MFNFGDLEPKKRWLYYFIDAIKSIFLKVKPEIKAEENKQLS